MRGIAIRESKSLVAALAVVTLLVGNAARAATTPRLTRVEFVRRLAELQVSDEYAEGNNPRASTEAKVLQRLGKPDEIRLPSDYPRIAEGSKEYCYGCDGRGTFPTLGRVEIRDGRVASIVGADGAPPPADLISERALRLQLREIDALPDPNIGRFKWDPGRAIQLLNKLRALGPRRAEAIAKEYLRLTSSRIGSAPDLVLPGSPRLFLVFGTLFPVPREAPRSPGEPITLLQDIPLLRLDLQPNGVAGFALEDLEDAMVRGRWRSTPLRPPDDPVAAFSQIGGDAMLPIFRPVRPAERAELMAQLLRLIDPRKHWSTSAIARLRAAKPEDVDTVWSGIIDDLRARHLKWDGTAGRYVFPATLHRR